MDEQSQRAIELFKEHLAEMEAARCHNKVNASFRCWIDSTQRVFTEYLPNSPHFERFRQIQFGPNPFRELAQDETDNPEVELFNSACEEAKLRIEGAIQEIQKFGLPQPTSPVQQPPKSGGSVNIYGDVINLAVAVDQATQQVSQQATIEGQALKQIGDILQESRQINLPELREALDAITKLATEMQKPKEKWNWRSVLEFSNLILTVAGHAKDVVTKLAPQLQAIVSLCEAAKHVTCSPKFSPARI